MNGIVIKSTGSWYSVMQPDGSVTECRIRGVFRMKGIKSTNPIAVGDRVTFEAEGADKGVITAIEERKNYIIRRSINLSKQSHILAVNVDQALLIATLAFPRTSTGFIDRFLLTAEAYHIPAILVFNKSELFQDDEASAAAQQELIALYERIGYRCIEVSAKTGMGIEKIKELTKDKTSLVAGHSGVGKSTLINALDSRLQLKTGEISGVHLKGKHTTTFAEMHSLAYGGFIIDTPGIKELGLVDMKKEELSHYFPEMRALMHSCKFNNCLHLNEPKCAVLEAVENGTIAASRYNSYLGILQGEELEEEY